MTEMASMLRAAFAELGLLLRGEPVRSRQWRDFWLVWIPWTALMSAAFLVLDADPFSTRGLPILAVGAILAGVSAKLLERQRR